MCHQLWTSSKAPTSKYPILYTPHITVFHQPRTSSKAPNSTHIHTKWNTTSIKPSEEESYKKRAWGLHQTSQNCYKGTRTNLLWPRDSSPHSTIEPRVLIIKESQKAEDEAHNCKSFYHTLSEICSHSNTKSNSTTYTAEEAGLIMPPLSPWSYSVGTVEAFATPRQFEP